MVLLMSVDGLQNSFESWPVIVENVQECSIYLFKEKFPLVAMSTRVLNSFDEFQQLVLKEDLVRKFR